MYNVLNILFARICIFSKLLHTLLLLLIVVLLLLFEHDVHIKLVDDK
jgi:hypothetical protein